jgi:iron complex transport system ATP-binding protein
MLRCGAVSELIAQDLRVHLGTREVIAAASLTLRPGELVLLAGRNGTGKTTLLRALLGALLPTAGSITLSGRPLSQWQGRERARQLAFVPQSVDTPFEFTGRELVTMGRHPHRPRGQPLTAADLVAIAQALQTVDAASFCDRPVTTLSGGEQRRIAVARALATAAPLLLLDEPTNNLDLEHALQLVTTLQRLAREGRGVLLASHDLNLVAGHCDRVVLLHEGRVFADAAPEVALSAANLQRVFGVHSGGAEGYFPRAFRLPAAAR